jgi:hypothetical protein
MRSFATQTEARQFFIEKITEQAQREGIAISYDERQMLLWSASAPDSVADPALAERLAQEISDADYETKIAGLLKNSFKADTAVDPAAKETWRAAVTVLSAGDHYIVIMVEQAIAKQLKPWWRLW